MKVTLHPWIFTLSFSFVAPFSMLVLRCTFFSPPLLEDWKKSLFTSPISSQKHVWGRRKMCVLCTSSQMNITCDWFGEQTCEEGEGWSNFVQVLIWALHVTGLGERATFNLHSASKGDGDTLPFLQSMLEAQLERRLNIYWNVTKCDHPQCLSAYDLYILHSHPQLRNYIPVFAIGLIMYFSPDYLHLYFLPSFCDFCQIIF